jgi:hypothetical protein
MTAWTRWGKPHLCIWLQTLKGEAWLRTKTARVVGSVSDSKYTVNVKGKAVPLRSIEAHLGDRRYSSYCFLTSALEGGEWSASRPGRALPPGKEPPVPIVQGGGWAPEPVWTQRLEEKSSASVGDRTPPFRSVGRHYTDWATPAQVPIFSSRMKIRFYGV